MGEMIRVLVVDDHEIVRAGLASLLHGADDVEIVGDASTADAAVAAARDLRPDVVLIDIKMAGRDGLDATAQIRAAVPETAVLILTMFDEAPFIEQAIRSGAGGYLLKGIARDDLIAAIRRAAAGERLFDPALVCRLARTGRSGSPDGPGRAAPAGQPARLTARELEVLQAIAAGLTNQQISRALTISVETVKTHVQRVIQKLGVSDRTQAAVYAVTSGLVVAEAVRPPRG